MTRDQAQDVLSRAVPQENLPDTAPVEIYHKEGTAALFVTGENDPAPSTPILLTWGELKELLK